MSNGLEEYQKKRRLEKTPEPKVEVRPPGDELSFVVQKHKASHLHYDFRLELDGVLKSWAVPKGPTLDPKVKRLAMMVEDHPIDYRSFEGVIPEGNYGAGSVIVWDSGTYHSPETTERGRSELLLRQGLGRGNLKFVLHGEKLQGEFALVRLKKAGENAWLLIKKLDGAARDGDVTENDRSVLSNRTVAEVEASEAVEDVNLQLSDAPLGEMPRNVYPMLASLVEEVFDDPDWVYEVKWDGYRAIAEVSEQTVRLYSRNQRSLSRAFAPVVDSLKRLGHSAVLDGEVVVVDESGKANFQLLQNFELGARGNLVYYVFDLLYLDGHDLRKLPLLRRQRILRQVLSDLPHIRFSDHVEGTGILFFRAAAEQGLEGIVAKKKDSIYEEGERSRKWLKVKKQMRQEAVIAGFTEPRGGRTHLGALILGVYDAGELVNIGHCGGGFDERTLGDVRKKLDPLIRETAPFRTPPRTNAPVHWVRPELVCEVRFSEWTDDGLMRHPVFMGLRMDKRAEEVRRELPSRVPKEEASRWGQGLRLRIGGRALQLTNLDKVYWPGQGYTKRDLIDYYRNVAPILLRHVRDRPQNLLRHPEGITGASFYQKDVDEQPPKWVTRVRIGSESKEREITYLVCQDEATLVYLANLGCIEINPWNSRLGTLDFPDYLVLDLDPLGVGFDAVVEAALVIREILESAGAPSYCKTSGATGMHIYVPMGARYDYESARTFALIVAHIASGRLPATTSVERSPGRRRGKVYIDCLQNRRGQTLVAPYSVRARPGAPVSTPLKWEEVHRSLDPAAHTMKTVLQRIDEIGDAFMPVLGKGIDLQTCIDNLNSGVIGVGRGLGPLSRVAGESQ
ncbi:MAG: DNA ligase D [Chloroflexi bacterium]|nr:DNA ligase D [Chloroflexota bacterium]